MYDKCMNHTNFLEEFSNNELTEFFKQDFQPFSRRKRKHVFFNVGLL